MVSKDNKKQDSRIMDKLRKRLKRAKGSLEKRIENKEFDTADSLRSAKSYLKSIEEAIDRSYYDRKGKKYFYTEESLEDVTKAVSYRARNEINVQVDKRNEDTVHSQDQSRELIDYVNKSGKLDIKHVMKDTNRQIRKNLQFERDLAQSRIEGGVSPISNLETTVFYRATQSIWESSNLEFRNVAIMKHFNVTSLEEAFEIVMNDENVKKELERVKELSSKIDDTNKKMAGKDKDEEDWKYNSAIIGTISRRMFK